MVVFHTRCDFIQEAENHKETMSSETPETLTVTIFGPLTLVLNRSMSSDDHH